MHVRARPPAAVLYGALLAHTLVSAGNYLFAKRALMAIIAGTLLYLPLGLGALRRSGSRDRRPADRRMAGSRCG